MQGENDNADSVSFSWVIKDRSITLKPSHQALPLLQDKKEIKSKDLYWSKLHSRESVTAKEMSKNLCPAAMAPLGSEWNKPTNHQWLVISRELAFIYFSCSVLGSWNGWRVGKERAYQFSCWKVFPLSRTEIWTSSIYVIYYPSCAIYPLNSQNFHVDLNLWQYSVIWVERIWVSLCTSNRFGAVSMSKGIYNEDQNHSLCGSHTLIS